MKVSFKNLLPLAAAGLISLTTSCSSVTDRAKRYMAKNNHTQANYNLITESGKSRIIQSKLDSVAYRDIFMGTKAAEDSTAVAEFNKIAAKMRVSEDLPVDEAMNAVENKLVEEGISAKEWQYIDNIISEPLLLTSKSTILQYSADNWAYRNFFKKIGILDDELNKKCDDMSLEVRPPAF